MRSLSSDLKHSLFATSMVANILLTESAGSEMMSYRNASLLLFWAMVNSNLLCLTMVLYISNRHHPRCKGTGSCHGTSTINVRPNSRMGLQQSKSRSTLVYVCMLVHAQDVELDDYVRLRFEVVLQRIQHIQKLVPPSM